ncbi:MAG: PQQ-binding-like beta-propeller repeat protein [Thermoplasmatota archaeon]
MGIEAASERSFTVPTRMGTGAMTIVLMLILLPLAAPSLGDWTEWRGGPLNDAVESGKGPTKGDLIWSYMTGDQVLSSPVFYQGGMLIGSDDGKLYCLDTLTGEVNWKFSTSGSIQATPLIHEGRAYFGSFDRKFYCIELPPAGGSPFFIWSFECQGQIISSAHLYGDSVVFADISGYVYRLDLQGGEVWSKKLSIMEIWGSPAIDSEEGLIYIGDTGKTLYCIDAENGDIERDLEHFDLSEIYSSPLLHEGMLYYTGGADETLYALDLSSWEHSWTFWADGNDAYSSPVISGDRIYFGSFEYTWCLPLTDPDGSGNISLDEVVWVSPTEDFQGGSSPLIAEGRVYIGSDNWKLYCFDQGTGMEIWNFSAKGYIYSSPALHNGSIFFGSSDRSVYSIGDRPPGLIIEVEPLEGEITSDDVTTLAFQVTNDEGVPQGGSMVTFTSSAGYVGFDQEGNTRLEHETDGDGMLTVFYFPPVVSSRSTMDINIRCWKEGLRSGSLLIQIIVEPGEDDGSGGSDDTSTGNSERVPHIAAISLLGVLNLIISLIVVVWTIRNRYEKMEVEGS